MSPGLVDVTVAMDAKVELLSSQDKALVHGGKQKVLLPSEIVYRHGQEAMVTPGVASHYGSVAIGSGLVGADDLPLKGI